MGQTHSGHSCVFNNLNVPPEERPTILLWFISSYCGSRYLFPSTFFMGALEKVDCYGSLHVIVYFVSYFVYLPFLSFQIPSPWSCGFVLLPHPDYFHLFTLCVYL